MFILITGIILYSLSFIFQILHHDVQARHGCYYRYEKEDTVVYVFSYSRNRDRNDFDVSLQLNEKGIKTGLEVCPPPSLLFSRAKIIM